MAIIQTLPYFSNKQQPVALILQIVRERLFLLIQAETQQTNPIYYHQNQHNRLKKIVNDLAVSRQKVQALDTHQNPESNQTYSFLYLSALIFFNSKVHRKKAYHHKS